MTALEQLIEAIRIAAARADFAALEVLAPQFEAEMAAMGPLSPAALVRIKAQAGRTAGSLAAAGRGLFAARRRLQELRGAAAGFRTYDRSGHTVDFGHGHPAGRRF